MARNRRARRKRKPPAGMGQRGIPPTPETRRKLKADVIGGLLTRRRMELHHAAAAVEIRTVLEAVGRGMFATSQAGNWNVKSTKHRTYRDFISRMSAGERRMWERHYLPWSREVSLEIVSGLGGTGWLQLILDIVVDNTTLRAAETRYAIAHGRAFDYLVDGLERYHRYRQGGI